MKRCRVNRSIVPLFALLVLSSCSEADTDVPSAAPSASQTQEVAGGGKKRARPDGGRGRESKKSAGNKGHGDGTADDGGPGSSDKPSDSKRKGPGRDAFNDSGAEDDNSSAAYPAAGDYVYAQSGFEKFCGGGRCEKQTLPKQETARITLSDRSADRAVVVTETGSSDDRMLRTTTAYSRTDALITDVYTRLTYEGFAFENEYQPAPPVESLRFPLQDGASWKGSWKDSTSGDYEVRVFGPTSVTVSGRAVRAFQVATTTEFRGEFSGRAKTLAWIDPATKAVVKLSGSADLSSTYGRYVTEFSSSLRAGPGY